MGVSLDPINCVCGRVCAYTVRGGPEHESAELRDPFTWVATAVDRESGGRRWAFVVGAYGQMQRTEQRALVYALIDLGYDWVAWEHDGETSTITRIDVERMRG